MTPGKKGIEELLEDAVRAGASNDNLAAVESLVGAWAIAPTDRIATLVLAIGARIPAPSIEGKNLAVREAAWLELAETLATSAVPTLVSYDWPIDARVATARMKLLRKFPPDPRIVRSIVEMRRAGRYETRDGLVFWGFAFETLYEWRYPAVHDVFATCLDGSTEGIEMLRLEPLLARPRHPEPRPSEAAVALLAQLESETVVPRASPSGARQHAELLDAVYETPHDDAPRLVLADFLIEEGDPRGEFIQLDVKLARDGKLPAKAKQRHAALARAAGRTWLDGLGPGLSHPVLRRGFAATATITDVFDPSLRPHRLLERLWFWWGNDDDDDGIARAALDPNLVSLHTFLGCNAVTFHALLRAGIPRHLERIDLGNQRWDEPRDELDGPIVLTASRVAVRELELAMRVLALGYLDALKVETLSVEGTTATLLELASSLAQMPPTITRVDVEDRNLHDGFVSPRDLAGWIVSFQRAPNDRWTYAYRWSGRGAMTVAERDEFLAKLPVEISPSVRPSPW